MAHQTGMGRFVIGRNAEAVHMVDDHIFHPVHFLRQNQTPIIFDDLMGSSPKKAGKCSIFVAGNRILRLVAIAMAGGRRQYGHFLQAFAAHAVQASTNALCL